MISEKLEKLIGKQGDVVILEIEKGAIRKFADAVDDHNPLFWDDDYARESSYGGLVAPPGFFGWPVIWTTVNPFLSPLKDEMVTILEEAGFNRILDGGIEIDFIRPVYAGDVLACVPKIISFTERESKTGKMIISKVEFTYTNQNALLVARMRQVVIHR